MNYNDVDTSHTQAMCGSNFFSLHNRTQCVVEEMFIPLTVIFVVAFNGSTEENTMHC